MKETELKPCDAPLKASERYMKIRDTLDFELRAAACFKRNGIIIDIYDARLIYDAVDVLIDILKHKEADNEREITDK